jgi:hypothetical protein
MKLNNLKFAWDQHKEIAQTPDITRDDILAAIGGDLNRNYQSRRLLYNTFLFSTLIIFCQTC